MNFLEFRRQRDAEGYAKADGYNMESFKKLSNEEKKETEKLLVSDLEKNESNAIETLVEIGSDKIIQSLENKLAQTKEISSFRAGCYTASPVIPAFF